VSDEAIVGQVLQLQVSQVLLDGLAVLSVDIDVLTFYFGGQLP